MTKTPHSPRRSSLRSARRLQPEGAERDRDGRQHDVRRRQCDDGARPNNDVDAAADKAFGAAENGMDKVGNAADDAKDKAGQAREGAATRSRIDARAPLVLLALRAARRLRLSATTMSAASRPTRTASSTRRRQRSTSITWRRPTTNSSIANARHRQRRERPMTETPPPGVEPAPHAQALPGRQRVRLDRRQGDQLRGARRVRRCRRHAGRHRRRLFGVGARA